MDNFNAKAEFTAACCIQSNILMKQAKFTVFLYYYGIARKNKIRQLSTKLDIKSSSSGRRPKGVGPGLSEQSSRSASSGEQKEIRLREVLLFPIHNLTKGGKAP